MLWGDTGWTEGTELACEALGKVWVRPLGPPHVRLLRASIVSYSLLSLWNPEQCSNLNVFTY